MTMTKRRPIELLDDDQRAGVRHMLDHKRTMFWLPMGFGKTVTSLTTIAHLLDCFEIRGVLIAAPLRVVQTVWKQEAALWQHTHHLKIRLIHGDPQQRKRAIAGPADVYVVNYENLPWLVNELNILYLARERPLPFDMVVFDEITKCKSARVEQGSTRLRPVIDHILPHVDRVAGLTGTPLPNGYQDLFGQYFVLDDGKRLGRSNTSFLSRFFAKDAGGGRKIFVTQEGKKTIHRLISDITFERKGKRTTEEYVENEIVIPLPPKVRKAYEKMEKEFFHEFDSGAELLIDSKAALVNKCLQFSNGAMYHEDSDQWEEVHTAKMDALEELIEGAGDPVLLAYNYKHDAERIIKRFGDKVFWLNSKIKGREAAQVVRRWNDGLIPVMMGHPASIGHGLNLQYGSHTVAWFGLNWSWELYSQFIARLDGRKGQKYQVTVHQLMVENTMDFAVKTALKYKQSDEDSARQAIRDYRKAKFNEMAA